MIYQGTVWGAWFWNLFYEDARFALLVHEFQEIVFADDLNAFRAFPLQTLNHDLFIASQTCQAELHSWGAANQIELDSAK